MTDPAPGAHPAPDPAGPSQDRADPPATDRASGPLLLLPVPELPAHDGCTAPRLTVVLRESAGERVAEGYTSAERLVDSCGPAQPWVAISVADSMRLLAEAGASVLIVDPGAPGGAVGIDLSCAGTDVRAAGR